MERLALIAILLAGCAGAPGPAAEVVARCQALVQAPPHEWPPALTAVLDDGPPAAVPLCAAITAHPGAPGVQAALTALGRVGGPAQRTFLEERLRDPARTATEAALALGHIGDPAARPALARRAVDALENPSVRAAAAASLLRLGDRTAATEDLLIAMLLAGSPAGRDPGTRQGLPERSRWAHERHIILTAVDDVVGAVFGMDMDAPWPVMERGVTRLHQWFEGQR